MLVDLVDSMELVRINGPTGDGGPSRIRLAQPTYVYFCWRLLEDRTIGTRRRNETAAGLCSVDVANHVLDKSRVKPSTAVRDKEGQRSMPVSKMSI